MKTRFDYWYRTGRMMPPYATQFTRQQREGKREPQRDMSNKKPYRTKAQKKLARKFAEQGDDGVWRSIAPKSYHPSGASHAEG